VNIKPNQSLKRQLYNFQNRRHDRDEPDYGPPLPGQSKWLRLDPNEILVHNMKALDHVDDLIEDKMRERYESQIEGPSKLVKDFVNSQTISDLHSHTIPTKESWTSSNESSLDIKPKSKGIFKR
jgi:hypothetical protein